MNDQMTLCTSETSDSAASYYAGNDAASSEGGTSSSNGIPVATSRMSLLPYFVAATVATMFLMLYVWSNRNKEQQLHNEELLGSGESFHGSVARRFERVTTGAIAVPGVVQMESGGTIGYAIA
jgi:hypothetical protein